jgi:hypothetical protein
MSSLYSDPPFRRGSSALGLGPTDVVTTDAIGVVEGRAIVGTVKVFQDMNPTTGAIISDRLVYCVAARYKGSAALDATTNAGLVYLFDTAAPLEQFGNAAGPVATSANLTSAIQCYGVLDEYLTGSIQPNDIVWLVVKGPCAVKQTAAAINAAAFVGPSTAGSVATAASAAVAIGVQIAGANTTAAIQSVRVNLANPTI